MAAITNVNQSQLNEADKTVGNSTNNSLGKASSSNVSTDTFLTLLIAQLKSQNPLDPMNPNEFVAQLAQFNSLSQLIEIKQLLQQTNTPQQAAGAGASSLPGGIG